MSRVEIFTYIDIALYTGWTIYVTITMIQLRKWKASVINRYNYEMGLWHFRLDQRLRELDREAKARNEFIEYLKTQYPCRQDQSNAAKDIGTLPEGK